MSQTRIFRHNARVLPGIAENLRQLQEDLEVARRIQHRLLPEPPAVPGCDLAVFYQPAGEVGGDFYDFLPLDGGRTGILVADASGKGLAGALLMVEARAMLRAIASVTPVPREILTGVNRVLLRDLDRGMFVTVFFLALDAERRTVAMACAGHTPMLLWRAASRRCEMVAPRGLVVGAANEQMFTDGLREESLALEKGDRFVLFTDGVSELMNPVRDEFGIERLEAFVNANAARTSEEFLRSLSDAMEMHRAGQPQSDDITVVTGRMA